MKYLQIQKYYFMKQMKYVSNSNINFSKIIVQKFKSEVELILQEEKNKKKHTLSRTLKSAKPLIRFKNKNKTRKIKYA